MGPVQSHHLHTIRICDVLTFIHLALNGFDWLIDVMRDYLTCDQNISYFSLRHSIKLKLHDPRRVTFKIPKVVFGHIGLAVYLDF